MVRNTNNKANGGDHRAFSACVLGPVNNAIESEFKQLVDGRFRVKFQPPEAGIYKIQIFNGKDNQSVSEFVHDVSEENVGEIASFTINIKEQKNNYSATVTSPTNKLVECTVEQQSGENCSVRFLPKEIGDHIIRIFQDDSNIPVSEFACNVTDLNCEVGTAPVNHQRIRVGEKTKLIIDPNTGRARKYRATITTADNKEIDCDFEEFDDDKCKVRFIPEKVEDYFINIFKIGSNEVVYEFTFSAEQKNVGQITAFTVTIQEYKPQLTANITSPSGARVDCTIKENDEENWGIQFVPRELGDHVIKLFQDESSEPISQFVYNVVERKDTLPHGRNAFQVGETVNLTFNIDGRMVASDTEFSATVISPSNKVVKCIFEELDDGTCKVRFVPKELGKYVIKLLKVGKDAPIYEFSFDAEEEHQEETASFTITIKEQKSMFSAIVTSPSNKEVDCVVEETGDEHCFVRFTPTEIGDYTIRIFENNETLPVATLIYKIVDGKYDLTRKSPSENIFRVGELVRLTVDIAEAKNKFSATVTSPSNSQIDCTVEECEDGDCSVKFTPKEIGDYTIRIFQGNNPIPVSQFTYTLKEQSVPDTYTVNEQTNFSVNVSEENTRNYSATVTSPLGEDLHCRVQETDNGRCKVRFIPTELGDYVVRLFQDDMQVCQYTYKVTDLINNDSRNTIGNSSDFKKKSVSGESADIQDPVFNLADKASFHLNLEESASKFAASVMSPRRELINCDVEERNPNVFVIRFIPKELGDHVIKIYNESKSIPIYQFIYKVRGFLDKPVEFKVTSFSPEPGRLGYKITCPPKSKISSANQNGGVKKTNSSPHATTKQSTPTLCSGTNNCIAEKTDQENANVREDTNCAVNTNNAGKGALMVGTKGSKQAVKASISKHIGQQKQGYSLNYESDMDGNYSITPFTPC